MKRLYLLILLCLIAGNISARSKIKSVYYEFRNLEYVYTSYVAEYNLQDNQLVLKEQPRPEIFKFDDVIDCIRLDSIVCDLVKHIGKEIQHDQCASCKIMSVRQQKKKLSAIQSIPSYLASFNQIMIPAITIITNKGYLVLHPDYTNLNQYILCYKSKYYTIPTSECRTLIWFLAPNYVLGQGTV